MAKIVAGILLFISFTTAVLIVALDSHFFNKYYYEAPMPTDGWGSSWTWSWNGAQGTSWGNPLGRDAWATDMRDKSEDNWPDMWRGLKATIAFASSTVLFSFIGMIISCATIKDTPRKLICGLLLISLIGLLVSVIVFIAADKSQTGEVSFHKEKRDLLDTYRTDNNAETPNYLKIWRNAYYGSIVCMVVSCFFGLIGFILLLRKPKSN